MRLSVLLVAACCAQAQTSLLIRPEVITRCKDDRLGAAEIRWTYVGPGPVQIHVDGPGGPAMTGPEESNGKAVTGEWVHDGTVFVLTDTAGHELARATARVLCNLSEDIVGNALASGSYFPLQVGDEWAYRVNDRQSTATYLTRRVDRVEAAGGKGWFVVQDKPSSAAGTIVEQRYRSDGRGRIYRLNSQGVEELWLDASGAPGTPAVLTVESKGFSFRSALGSFPDSLNYTFFGGLEMERGTFVRGVGLARSEATMLAGSSGGFLRSLELVYARIQDRLIVATPASGLALSVESTELNVTGRQVTNCAVPCYFVACGLVPGADPPNTFKPCFEARVRLEGLQPSQTVELELRDSSEAVVFGTSQQLPVLGEAPDSVWFRQLPLYTAPNQPVPAGTYRVRARAVSATGAETGSATMAIGVR